MPKRLSQLEFISRAKEIHKNRYLYDKVHYINSNRHIVITCPKHGDFHVTPNNHTNNKSGCPKCYGKIKRTLEGFVKQADDVHGEYDYSAVIYVNDNTKVKIICKIHGHFKATPTNHIHRKSGCPTCAIAKSALNLSMGTAEFIRRGCIIHENFYNYSLVKYTNNHTKVDIICPKHGIFSQQPQLHLNQECGCPCCKSSKGERSVRKWLKKHNIVFSEQKTFKKCKYKKMLPFDFYLPEKNILIEYQGYQHYDKRSNFYQRDGSDTFEIVQLRDNIKREFAKNSGFQLIEIHYNKSIDKILQNIL